MITTAIACTRCDNPFLGQDEDGAQSCPICGWRSYHGSQPYKDANIVRHADGFEASQLAGRSYGVKTPKPMETLVVCIRFSYPTPGPKACEWCGVRIYSAKYMSTWLCPSCRTRYRSEWKQDPPLWTRMALPKYAAWYEVEYCLDQASSVTLPRCFIMRITWYGHEVGDTHKHHYDKLRDVIKREVAPLKITWFEAAWFNRQMGVEDEKYRVVKVPPGFRFQ